jgi:glycine cleavage system pyridoxal-binding protein P
MSAPISPGVLTKGAKGLKKIATEVHSKALTLAKSFTEAGFTLVSEQFFDTITVNTNKAKILFNQAQDKEILRISSHIKGKISRAIVGYTSN